MELPPALRRAVDRALEGVAPADVARPAARLSDRYRTAPGAGRPYVAGDADALAYLATRLPATFAAVRASLGRVAQARPDYAPRTLLDVGAGPGTAAWAAADCWASLDDAMLIEGSAAMRRWGSRLMAEAPPVPTVGWRAADLAGRLADVEPRDLVTLGYVLGELAPAAADRLLQQL